MPEQEKIPFTQGGAVNVLIDKDHKNRRLLVVNSGKIWDPEVVSSDSLFRMFYLSKNFNLFNEHKFYRKSFQFTLLPSLRSLVKFVGVSSSMTLRDWE